MLCLGQYALAARERKIDTLSRDFFVDKRFDRVMPGVPLRQSES